MVKIFPPSTEIALLLKLFYIGTHIISTIVYFCINANIDYSEEEK